MLDKHPMEMAGVGKPPFPRQRHNGFARFSQIPDSFPCLREGVERFFITDINNPASGSTGQSTMAVMWDAWGTTIPEQVTGGNDSGSDAGIMRMNHVPGGSNVLYMDGHVEWVRLDSKYPVRITGEFDTPDNDDLIVLMGARAGGFG